MKTWPDALKPCTAGGGSVGRWPPPDSGACTDISCPRPPLSGGGCAGAIWLATCRLSPSLASARHLAESGRSPSSALGPGSDGEPAPKHGPTSVDRGQHEADGMDSRPHFSEEHTAVPYLRRFS